MSETQIDIRGIMDSIPHRYPFLLVDRIIEQVPGERIVGIKNVTMNEPCFQGHFPGNPIFPGVLIVEAMAQVGAVLLLGSLPDRHKKLAFFMGIDGCKFRRTVVPGDQIRLEAEVLRLRKTSCKIHGRALVDGELAAEATIMSMVVDKPEGA